MPSQEPLGVRAPCSTSASGVREPCSRGARQGASACHGSIACQHVARFSNVACQHGWRTPKQLSLECGSHAPAAPDRAPMRPGREAPCSAASAHLNMAARCAWRASMAGALQNNSLWRAGAVLPRRPGREALCSAASAHLNMAARCAWRASMAGALQNNSLWRAGAVLPRRPGREAPCSAASAHLNMAARCAWRASMAGALQNNSLWSAGAMLPRRPTGRQCMPRFDCMPTRCAVLQRGAPAMLAHSKKLGEPRSRGAQGASCSAAPAHLNVARQPCWRTPKRRCRRRLMSWCCCGPACRVEAQGLTGAH